MGTSRCRRHSWFFSVLQLCKILPHREGFTVAPTGQPACCRFIPFHSPAPNSPAQLGRGHEPLRPALPAWRRPCEWGALSSVPSLSASFPISAVFHSAPPRSERFQKTPQRSEGTQRGKGGCAHCVLKTEAVRVFHPPLPPHVLRVGCGPAARCSSYLCGSLIGCHCIATAH